MIFTGSQSSPDEDRLLKHLFDPDHQTNNLKTTPILNINETINVIVGIEIRKLIELVMCGTVYIKLFTNLSDVTKILTTFLYIKIKRFCTFYYDIIM